MPKLIIKQNNETAVQQSNMATWLSVGGLLVLLAAVALGAFYFTKAPLPGSELKPLTFSSAANDGATTSYQSLYAILGDLMTEYEALAGRGVDDYQKNLMLQGKAESILGHLDKMEGAAQQLGLNATEAAEVSDRHQFYQDFWQAKLYFRELRVSRFEGKDVAPADEAETERNAAVDESTNTQQDTAATDESALPALNPEAEAVAESAESAESITPAKPSTNSQQVEKPQARPAATSQQAGTVEADDTAPTTTKPKFQFAKPPADMDIPAGLCDLTDPDSSCKADAADATGTPALDSLALPADGLPPLPDDLALPTDGLPPLPEALALPEDGLPPLPDDLALPEDGLPPLPEDLSLPEEGLPPLPGEGLTLTDGVAVAEGGTQVKKPGFRFAQPPEGMAMPAGFCDLSNPENSCKPESDLLSDVDQPVLEGEAELSITIDQSQL